MEYPQKPINDSLTIYTIRLNSYNSLENLKTLQSIV